MRTPLEKRKPAVVATTGSHEIGMAGRYSYTEDTPNRLHLQAQRIRSRFPGLSWPVARRVAELAYGGAP